MKFRPNISTPTLGSSLGTISLLLMNACTSGQFGGEVNRTEEGTSDSSSQNCEDAGSKKLGVKETSEVNITAERLVSLIEGTHTAGLVWRDQTGFDGVEVTPAAGDSTITLEIVPLVETAILVNRVDATNTQGGNSLQDERARPPCRDEMRVEADVTVTSENGAFNDTFRAQFVAQNGLFISSAIPLTPGMLEGSFGVDVSRLQNGKADDTILRLGFALGSLSGEIVGSLSTSNSDVASGASMIYGSFPLFGCESGYLIRSETEFSQSLSQAIESRSQFDLTWDNAEKTELTLMQKVGKMCFESSPYDSMQSLSLDLLATVRTGDGRIDGKWSLPSTVQLSAEGKATQISVHRSPYNADYYAKEDFEQETGISGVRSSASDLSFEFSYDMNLATEEKAQGKLVILEATVPDCVRDDFVAPVITNDDGETSSSGCAGVDFRDVDSSGTNTERAIIVER